MDNFSTLKEGVSLWICDLPYSYYQYEELKLPLAHFPSIFQVAEDWELR